MPRLLLREYDARLDNAHLADFPPDGLVLSGDVLRVGRLSSFDVVVWTGTHRFFFELHRVDTTWCLWTTAGNPVFLNDRPITVSERHPLHDGDVFGTPGTVFEYRKK